MIRINNCDIDFYHNIKKEFIRAQILRVIDINKFIVVVKHNYTLKKIFCKAKGYKLKNDENKLEALAKINGLINSNSLMVNLKTYGLDKDGL